MKVSDIDIRDAFFDEVYAIAAKDSNVIFLTADMGAFSLDRFKNDLSSQYINVGVAEQNLVSIAAGLALGGKRVFIYTIASFVTQRCYEQIKIDLCGMRLPVTIIGSGPGITYGSDGPTHHAIQDVAIMRALPEMTILNPSDPVMAVAAARIAYKTPGPLYVRIDKGKLPLLYDGSEDFSAGLALLKNGRDLMIIATGIMVQQAFKVADELARHSIDAGIIDLYRIKPINEGLLLDFIEKSNRVVTLEEHSIVGGIGSAVSEILVDNGKALPVKRIAIADKNCVGMGYGNREWMHSLYGLDVDSVVRTILGRRETGNMLRRGLSEITISDFANIFGISVDAIPDRCRNVIKNSDFRYSVISGAAREAVFLRILNTLNSNMLMISGPYRKDDWEKGWMENLENFRASKCDLRELIPKFVKKKESIRFQGNYIMPVDLEFETNFVTFIRYYLFGKYFAEASKVYEFGCGTGLNLVAVSELFPEMELYGLDWSEASCKIIDELAQKLKLKLNSALFDMFSPDEKIDLDNTCAVFTIGAMEQLGTDFKAFSEFLLKKRPSVCINIEPIYELDDSDNLFDYLAICYMEKRNYLRGYLEYLKKLEKDREVDILEVRKTFGGLYHDAYSYVVWKPKN